VAEPPTLVERFEFSTQRSVADELKAVIQGPEDERAQRVLVLLEWARRWNDVDGRMRRAMAA
jgi:hypothetical protein